MTYESPDWSGRGVSRRGPVDLGIHPYSWGLLYSWQDLQVLRGYGSPQAVEFPSGEIARTWNYSSEGI